MGKDWDRFTDRELVTRSGHDRASSGAGFGALESGSLLPTYGGKMTSFECAVCGVRDAFRKGCRCETPDWRAINPNGTAAAVAFQTFNLLWAQAAYRVLRPGGHLLAFGGTRTYHRLAVGLEDAGFEIRDSLHWIYGSGFPKSLDVSKQIDKMSDNGAMAGPNCERTDKGEPITDEAKRWSGWGTALKPAHEPVVLARKPLAGTVAENVLAHGVGALNVRACEIGAGTFRTVPGAKGGPSAGVYQDGLNGTPSEFRADAGRWPSNVMLAHLPTCQGSTAEHTDVLCADGCPVAELNEASEAMGIHSAGSAKPPGGWPDSPDGMFGVGGGDYGGARKGDAGGAARFFYVAKTRTRERVGGTVRNLHPTVKPVELMRYLIRLVTPPGGLVLDPFLGSGSTGCAAMLEGARFVGVEMDADSFETAVARIGDYAFASGRGRPLVE